ncbi:MAG: DUF2846 domain-containing protein [Verrucomicrobiota bacterium]|nr:DUF2846 domain-containing protein [Verrucomicrobiota bacterium]
MNKSVLFAALACIALAGCATGPNFKTYSSTLSQPKNGESRIWFYRPSKVIGFAVQPTVFLNGTPVGKAQPGCFFYADRPPGAYEIQCTTEWADQAHLTVVENRADYVRLSMLPGVWVYHVLPKVVPEDEALREIQRCHLITADGRNANWKPPEKSAGTNHEAGAVEKTM